MRYLAILIFSFSVIILSCGNNDNPESLKEYYFPYKTFTKPTTYTYVNQNNTTEKMYWKMWIQVLANDTFFITEISDENNQLNEYLKEQITPTGSIITEHISYFGTSPDSSKSTGMVEKKEVFNWKTEKGQNYTWAINYQMPDSYNKDSIFFSKTRLFTGNESNIDFNGKTYQCLLFEDSYKMKVKATSGDTKNLSYPADSYYAKNLGLLHYVQKLKGRPERDFKLVAVTTN